MVEYRWLRDLSVADRGVVAGLYVDAFSDSLELIDPRLQLWKQYVEHALRIDRTLVALSSGAIVGAISYSAPGRREALSVWCGPLLRTFGVARGSAAAIVMGYEFKAPLPYGIGRATYIELLAVGPAHRGRYVGRGLIAALIDQLAAPAYSIQVDDNNGAGLTLYESVGFTEVGRSKEPWSAARKAGTMERVFMQLNVSDIRTGGLPDVEARTGSD